MAVTRTKAVEKQTNQKGKGDDKPAADETEGVVGSTNRTCPYNFSHTNAVAKVNDGTFELVECPDCKEAGFNIGQFLLLLSEPSHTQLVKEIRDASKKKNGEPRFKPACKNGKHHDAKVYTTKGNVRYCKCNTCGEFWKSIISGKPAVELREFCLCPECNRHGEIYNVQGHILLCKCNNCGHDWRQSRGAGIAPDEKTAGNDK